MDRVQAVHVQIVAMKPGVHEHWEDTSRVPDNVAPIPEWILHLFHSSIAMRKLRTSSTPSLGIQFLIGLNDLSTKYFPSKIFGKVCPEAFRQQLL